MSRCITALLAIPILLAACGPASATPDSQPTATSAATPVVEATSAPSAVPVLPEGFNPLTGRPAADPALLDTPAQLISISHFPAFGRPQAGLSFAPFVYEISITEGATRFLAVFYGEYPAPEAPPTGDCAVRSGAFVQTDVILGGRVWLDANENSIHDPGEGGVGGVCVGVWVEDDVRIAEASTDANGYYGFNLQPGRYAIGFRLPAGARFTSLRDAPIVLPGDLATEVELAANDTALNVGMTFTPSPPTPAPLPLAQVGPIRSGRLVYRYLADSFPNSCLIYAGASSEVLVELPQCYLVYHQFAGGGYMLDIGELSEVARGNKRAQGNDFDYSGYVFSDGPPPGGAPATQLNVFIAYLNQSGWTYDPLYESYLRFVDTSEESLAGVLFPDRDRLTGRQLHFENVMVLFAKHDVVSPTNLDIRLDPGKAGDALLFRDGLMYEIEWRMPADDEPSRMLQFLDTNGNPMPLKPGHTWVLVVTPESGVEEKSPGTWTVQFIPPEGAQ